MVDYSNRKGFTLAEILIAIGIVGVIAALTIPTIIEFYQKKVTVNKLKKVYTNFSQALVKSQQDNGESSSWTVTLVNSSYDDNLEYFNLYWRPYLKIIKECNTQKSCGYSKNGYGYPIDKDAIKYGAPANIPSFVLADGTFFYLRPYGYDGVKLQLLGIDINGVKGPNIISKDVFYFEVNTDRGIIIPYRYNPNNCYKGQPNGDLYRSCAGKIIKDGWKISKDYPW